MQILSCIFITAVEFKLTTGMSLQGQLNSQRIDVFKSRSSLVRPGYQFFNPLALTLWSFQKLFIFISLTTLPPPKIHLLFQNFRHTP